MVRYPLIIPAGVAHSAIDGLAVVTMKQVTDERGTVREFYRESTFADLGLPPMGPWVQCNITETRHGAVRGLHGEAMVKLVGVAAGEVFGAYVDTRADSRTRGAVVTLSLTKGTQVVVPRGVCNGFQAISPGGAQYIYSFDAEWYPGMAGAAITPLDTELGIPWPVPLRSDDPASVSAKDAGSPQLRTLLGD
jgi:dTDP-4-dehydrorhamnose 3,5-epimerase